MSTSSAAGPLAGYVWQVRRALLVLLRCDEGESVSLEVDDDITVARLPGELVSATQAKHSLNSGTLTLYSVELWKTLRIWADLFPRHGEELALILATTDAVDTALDAVTDPNTADDDELKALAEKLDNVAKAKGNAALERHYDAWLELPAPGKLALLRSTRILAAEPQLAALSKELSNEIRRRHIPQSLLTRVAREVEGWFLQTVSERLKVGGCTVRFLELWEVIDDIHQSLTSQAALSEPADNKDAQKLESDVLGTGSTFLEQLALLDASDDELRDAAKSFARARVSRQHWLQTKAVARLSINDFVTDLTDYWRQEHLASRRALKDDADLRKEAGWRTHDSCMRYDAHFCSARAPQYLLKGSYHMLSDELAVGWHPDFEKLMGLNDE